MLNEIKSNGGEFNIGDDGVYTLIGELEGGIKELESNDENPYPYPCDKCGCPMIPKNIIGEDSDLLQCLHCKYEKRIKNEKQD